ncbi:LacI family DNA-binding transcriptional regulator [Microbacterium capsulatum]|uniref:LacI family DNA-binding transcriptional regulator n=1 Tax=Microbacterium capsulatum TaxID=3041921 RepID=A0ABU0XKY3_9MICO|nr:LacI family DNA-binding transcriptional regulator [Microbacterium sp. ASV81]MDQ4215802.1 LacI family DNA-binding transcriptional regulator [Microbacterium sp. ASV81]
MVTIADVAKLAGVSKATASRAFSRPEVVSTETAQRVHSAAEKLGFVVNTAARLLAGGKSGILALVVPTLDNSFFTPIIAGAQESTDADGYQLTVVVHPLETAAELPSFERLRRQVDGLIVLAPRGSDEFIRAALGSTPTVLVDREIDGIPSVIADSATAFGALVESLIAGGHRRIVYLGGPAGSWQDRQRTAAAQAAAVGSDAQVTVVGPYDSTFAAGIEASAAVRESAPTAVVPYATALGLGVQFAYLVEGDRPPVVSSERAIVEALGSVDVPAIDVDGQGLGRTAAEMLLRRIAAPDEPAARVRLDVGLVLGPMRSGAGGAAEEPTRP